VGTLKKEEVAVKYIIEVKVVEVRDDYPVAAHQGAKSWPTWMEASTTMALLQRDLDAEYIRGFSWVWRTRKKKRRR
jgi:hypothetical protein